MAQKKELEETIIELQKRDILSDCANLENFLNLSSDQQTVYLGIDCTANSLHIGHLLPFMQAVRLAKIGFNIKLLLGGETSKIGDPSDKLKERPLIDPEIIISNQNSIEKQLSSLFELNSSHLDSLKKAPLCTFFSENENLLSEIYQILGIRMPTSEKDYWSVWRQYLNNIWPEEVSSDNFAIVNNHDWLGNLTFVDFIDKYGRNITINYLLGKETIRQRIASKSGLSFSAFTYSLLQAYDFLHLYKEHKCHGQIGASDQWGNFTTGIKMINSFENNNKCFALAFKLILDENGRKISKSDTGSAIVWISEEKTSFSSLFNYFSNMSDERALQYITKFTFLSSEQTSLLLQLNKPASLRILQRVLTELFFFLMHGKEGLVWLQSNAILNQKSSLRKS